MTDEGKPRNSIQELAASAKKFSDISKQLAASLRSIQPPDFSFPRLDRFEMPDIKLATQEEINEYRSASAFMKAVSDAAMEWKQSLPEGYVPAIIALLYGGAQIEAHNLAQVSFHGIRIHGMLNGSPCAMLAHQSTIQILCVAQQITGDSPRNPIGFIWQDHKIEV